MTSSKNADKLIARRLDDLMKKEPLALRGLIHNLQSKPYEWYDDDIAALLEQHKAEILKYIQRKFHVGNVSLPTNDIKKLMSVGINWPELTAIVNQYKTSIIKNILETLKLDYRSVTDPVNTLTAMNLGWKELDAINRSLTALRKDITEADWRDDYDVEEIKSNIILDLYDSDFLAVIDSIGELSHFKNLGDIARVAKQLEYHKDNLMRTILRMAKESGTYHSLPVLNGLARLSIKWPELDIIRKSANADNKNITEANHALNAASYKVNIAGAVLRNDIDTLVEELAEFAWIPREYIGDVSKLTYILDQHKNRVMKGILSYMRSIDDPGICYIMPQILSGLENAGVKWPDLAIIDRSVEKIQKRIEDEEEARNDTP